MISARQMMRGDSLRPLTEGRARQAASAAAVIAQMGAPEVTASDWDRAMEAMVRFDEANRERRRDAQRRRRLRDFGVMD